ncbi:uncharacterized protein [Palaemon carinicauda]|uniref:uncharacterized protein isoform X4 n=1 Tax=Palaemon carinicauda TaxID=392227 RepID=UPI0035B5B275
MHLLINSAIWFAVIDFLSYSAIGHERKWHMIKPKRNKEEILKTEQLSPNALISRWRRQLIVQSKNQLPVQIKSRHQPVRLLSRKSHKVKDSEFHQEEENEKIWQPSIRLVYRYQRGRVSKNRFNDEVQKQGLLNSTTYSLVPVEPDAEIAHTVSQDVQSSILESNFTPNPLILSNKNADVRTVGSSNYSKSFGYSSAVSVKPLQGGSVKFHPQVKEKFMHDASDLVTLDLKYDVNQKNIRHKRTTPSSSDSDSSFRNRLQKVLQNIESGERTIKETFKTALSSLISNASNVMNGTSMETEGSQIYDAEQMKNTITDGQLVSSSNIPFTTSITPANEYVASTSDAIPDTTLQIQIKKTDHPSSSLGIGDFDEFYSSETHPEVVSAYAKIDDVDSHSVSKNSEFTSSNVFSVIDGEYYYPGVTSEMNMDYHSFTSDAESTTSDMTSIPIVDAEGSSSTNTQLPVVLDRLSTLNAEFPYNTENIKLPKARPHTTQVPVLELADNITNKQAWTTEQLPSSDEDLSLGNNSYSLLEEITTVIPVAVRSEADSDSDQGDVTEKVDTNPEYLSSYNEIESEEIDVITAFPTPAPKNETEDDSTGTVPVVFPFSTEIYSEIQNTSFNNRSLDAVIAILKPQVNEASTRDPVNEEREPLFEVRSFETHDNDSLDDLAFTSVLNESLDDTTTSIIYLPVHVQQNSSSGNKSITDVMAIIKHEAQPSMERTSNSFNNGSNDSGSVSLFTPEIFSNSSTNETIIVAHSDVFTPESVSFTPESVSFTPESISFTPESVSSTPEGSTSSSNKSMAEVMAILKPFNVSEISTLFPDSTISVYSTTAIPIYSDFPTSVESNTESLVKAPEALPEISTLQIGTLIYSENTSTTVDSVSESSSLAVFVPPLTAVPSTSSVANHEQMSTTTDIMILMHENLPTDWMSSAITEDYHSSSSSESSTIASVTETSINILLPEEVVTSTLLVDTPYPVSEIILSHDPLPETTVTSTTSGSAETDEIEQTVDLISTDPHNHTVVAISSAAAVIGLIIGFVGIALVRKAVKDRKKVYFIQPRSFRHH